MIRILQLDARAHGSPWRNLASRLGGDAAVLALFAVAYAVLTALGPLLRLQGHPDLTVLWPGAGLLFLALWYAERRLWPALVALQLGVEVLAAMIQGHWYWPVSAAIVTAHTVAGLTAAALMRHLPGGQALVRIHMLLWCLVAGVVGTATGALWRMLWAQVTGEPGSPALLFLHHWLASLFGGLALGPALLAWSMAHIGLFPRLSRLQRLELVLLAAAQGLLTWYIYRGVGEGLPTVARYPVFVIPGLVYGTLRLPARWALTLLSGTLLLAVAAVCAGGDPLGVSQPFHRMLWMQVAGITFAPTIIFLATFIGETRRAMGQLADSEGRYRSFIQISSEALWRVDLQPPMPVDLPAERRVQWLREHARVVECSAAFAQFAGVSGGAGGAWDPQASWAQALEAQLPAMTQPGYGIDGVRFGVPQPGRPRTFLAAFNGVVRDGALEIIWCVARDVSELVELNARLQREQERLRNYASRLTTAEEQARRATAIDLHDGIGQELVGISMTLKVLASRLDPGERVLLDEIRARLHRVQERTRGTISDLSPPGLYDLGLVPALQWLAVYLRTYDRLQVELDSAVDDARLPVELRVLAFRLVRELLRNVIKHAGVERALVIVSELGDRLRIEVADEGRGFEWQPDPSGAAERGFGLWSVTERVREARGMLRVESAPGRGARVVVELPLA